MTEAGEAPEVCYYASVLAQAFQEKNGENKFADFHDDIGSLVSPSELLKIEQLARDYTELPGHELKKKQVQWLEQDGVKPLDKKKCSPNKSRPKVASKKVHRSFDGEGSHVLELEPEHGSVSDICQRMKQRENKLQLKAKVARKHDGKNNNSQKIRDGCQHDVSRTITFSILKSSVKSVCDEDNALLKERKISNGEKNPDEGKPTGNIGDNTENLVSTKRKKKRKKSKKHGNEHPNVSSVVPPKQHPESESKTVVKSTRSARRRKLASIRSQENSIAKPITSPNDSEGHKRETCQKQSKQKQMIKKSKLREQMKKASVKEEMKLNDGRKSDYGSFARNSDKSHPNDNQNDEISAKDLSHRAHLSDKASDSETACARPVPGQGISDEKSFNHQQVVQSKSQKLGSDLQSFSKQVHLSAYDEPQDLEAIANMVAAEEGICYASKLRSSLQLDSAGGSIASSFEDSSSSTSSNGVREFNVDDRIPSPSLVPENGVVAHSCRNESTNCGQTVVDQNITEVRMLVPTSSSDAELSQSPLNRSQTAQAASSEFDCGDSSFTLTKELRKLLKNDWNLDFFNDHVLDKPQDETERSASEYATPEKLAFEFGAPRCRGSGSCQANTLSSRQCPALLGTQPLVANKRLQSCHRFSKTTSSFDYDGAIKFIWGEWLSCKKRAECKK